MNEGATPLFEAIDIVKRFGSFIANDHVNLTIAPAEIHALLGENGAGKSTLVKMMYGLIQPSAGEMRWQGERVAFHSPSDARRAGIGMVFQHFSLFEALTVAENVALSLDASRSMASIVEEVSSLSQTYGLPLEPRREVWRLSAGERQRIEIMRALMQHPKLLILDEPTSVLTPQEAQQLFHTLNRLKQEGRSILYISHKLDEVRQLCDVATILRHGKNVGQCVPRHESAGSMARMMVGTAINTVHTREATRGPVRVAVQNLSLPSADLHGISLKDISLSLASGVVTGIAGISGNGQHELFEALSGESLVARGMIMLDGKPIGDKPITDRRRLGLAFVPEERLGHGSAPDMVLSDNALLTRHAQGPMASKAFVKRSVLKQVKEQIVRAFDVRKSGDDPAAKRLSGGNLQKYLVGREVLRKPEILIVNQPTWGVDAGAAAAIRQALVDLAAGGAAVLVISQDLDELFEVAHEIAVINLGRLSEPVAAASLTREAVGLLMGGIHGEAAA